MVFLRDADADSGCLDSIASDAIAASRVSRLSVAKDPSSIASAVETTDVRIRPLGTRFGSSSQFDVNGGWNQPTGLTFPAQTLTRIDARAPCLRRIGSSTRSSALRIYRRDIWLYRLAAR